jgi:hypothetical protein
MPKRVTAPILPPFAWRPVLFDQTDALGLAFCGHA